MDPEENRSSKNGRVISDAEGSSPHASKKQRESQELDTENESNDSKETRERESNCDASAIEGKGNEKAEVKEASGVVNPSQPSLDQQSFHPSSHLPPQPYPHAPPPYSNAPPPYPNAPGSLVPMPPIVPPNYYYGNHHLAATAGGPIYSLDEAHRRDQAVAWANAAAGAAWYAAQVASQAAASCAALGVHPSEYRWREPYEGHRRNKRGNDDEPSQKNNRRRARWQSSDSSSSGGSWRRPPVKKKATSLLGKTGVAALFEWSSKQHITPTLMVQEDRGGDYFECTVYLPACKFDEEVLQEWGHGRGRSKGVAKQEAARNAIMALLPGVKFDETSGVINVLPSRARTSYSMDELPTLTKRLVIDRSNTYEENTKRAREATTSEEDSESAYFAREGASICSQMLAQMIQIDPQRLPSSPVFIFETTTTSRGIPFRCTGHLQTRDDLLRASGVGGTKREARHVASARLLALLFPQCHTMAAVKEAAEAKREEYARGRVLKQQAAKAAEAQSDALKPAAIDRKPPPPIKSNPSEPDSAHSPDAKALPTGQENSAEEEDLVSSVDATEGSPKRRKYSDDFGPALLLLNEQTECEDVGRTVLRRAEPIDLPRVLRLFYDDSESTTVARRPDDLECTSADHSHVVLLLCRAIAAFEDPPLGCAVLAREADDRLRVIQMANEHHLPEERFLECLESLAQCMKCTLEPKNTDVLLCPGEIKRMIGSDPGSNFKGQLQSVLEGSEEESIEEARPKKRGEAKSKPSKRSRVQ